MLHAGIAKQNRKRNAGIFAPVPPQLSLAMRSSPKMTKCKNHQSIIVVDESTGMLQGDGLVITFHKQS
jgi:hypothetical protein